MELAPNRRPRLMAPTTKELTCRPSSSSHSQAQPVPPPAVYVGRAVL
jgi:hypothetical protein